MYEKTQLFLPVVLRAAGMANLYDVITDLTCFSMGPKRSPQVPHDGESAVDQQCIVHILDLVWK